MFKAIQQLDCTGKPLDRVIVRDIYAVDKATDSFLIAAFDSSFSWIPAWTCRPYREGFDDDILKDQRKKLLKECYQIAQYALLNEQRREATNSKG